MDVFGFVKEYKRFVTHTTPIRHYWPLVAKIVNTELLTKESNYDKEEFGRSSSWVITITTRVNTFFKN